MHHFPKNFLSFVTFFIAALIHSFTSSIAHAGWNGKIFVPGQDQAIEETDLYQKLGAADFLVLGEKHYTAAVQEMEARVIRGATTAGSHSGRVTLGWEFLNRRDQVQISDLYGQVVKGTLSPEEFVQKTQNTPTASVYAPVIAAIRDVQGKLIATNLSREEKSPVSQGGISAVDPKLLPPNYDIGGENYRQRFVDVMGNHVPANKVANYFDAQCLTDDVMAWSFSGEDEYKILIAGSFHTDYRDGAVARLAIRNPGKIVSTLSIIDASDYSESDLMTLLVDTQWGPLADFVVFVNEPTSANP